MTEQNGERRQWLAGRWATFKRLSWHNRRRFLIHQLLVPKRQVMFVSDGYWHVWTGADRNPSDQGSYRLWRPWSPVDWVARLRQHIFGWWNYGTFPKPFADRLRASEPEHRRLREYLSQNGG